MKKIILLCLIISIKVFTQSGYNIELKKIYCDWHDQVAFIDSVETIIKDINGNVIPPSDDFYYEYHVSTNNLVHPPTIDIFGDLGLNKTFKDNDYNFIQTWYVIVKDQTQQTIFGTSDPVVFQMETDPVKAKQVIFKALDNNGNSLTSIHAEHWMYVVHSWNPNWTRFFTINHDEVLKSSPSFLSTNNQKFNNWNSEQTEILNHNSFYYSSNNTEDLIARYKTSYGGTTILCNIEGFIGASIEFEDPWLIDYNDLPYGMRNQGMSAIPKEHSSPFNPTMDSQYKGVFLNQNLTFDPTKPIYSVKIDATVQELPLYNTGIPSGRNHKLYFLNWSRNFINGVPSAEFQDSMDLLTPVVFKNENAVVSAKLKGTQLSSQTNAYNYNNQRKYAKTEDGYLHLVYESMGTVWYEVSSDNGATWKIQNNGRPISLVGKQPSLDFNIALDQWNEEVYQIVMVWQEKSGTNSKIKIAYFDRYFDTPDGIMNWRDTKDIASVSGTYESANCSPVVRLAFNMYNVVYKNGPSGYLLCRYDYINPNSGVIGIYGSPTTLTGTTAYSVNPSIAVNKINGGTVLVWEQIQNDELSSIKYAALYGSQISGSTTTISTNSGSPLNFSPSVSFAYNAPVVSWTGARNPGDGIDKRKAITTRGTGWGSFQVVGTDINFVNNNSAASTSEKTVISWSEGITNPVTKWMRRDGTSYSTPHTLSNSGYQSQLCSGTNFQTMSAMVFKNTTIPYYFLKSTTDFSSNQEEDGGGLTKITENDTIVTFGRSGVASINEVEFVFEIGDVIVGDSIIKFIEIPDTLFYISTNELNQHTRTNNFALIPETNFYFSNIYYVVQKSDPDTSLIASDAVNFKAELVNALTNQVVGTFDNITYNKNNLEKYASIDYEVDCSGITPGEYYLRLETNVNGNASYALANIINDNITLAKKNFNKVNFTGGEIPIAYDLAQNFPNPFNPSTTIRYQIPQNGMVTLKIYDILGAEVATLVNEEKVAGKYEVNFNASRLASGVYIYKIQAGSFINSKKMLLLK